MKIGDIVKIAQGVPRSGIGIILSQYDHPNAVCGRAWYTVLVQGKSCTFREDYLETLISEV